MKPLEAMEYAREACKLLAEGQPLPPVVRFWLVGALRKRITDSQSDLDRLLGLQSRSAGRLHAFSGNPERDRAIRNLAGDQGLVSERVSNLIKRVSAHRVRPDPEIADLESKFGRLPSSPSQLQRILSGRTAASTVLERHLIR